MPPKARSHQKGVTRPARVRIEYTGPKIRTSQFSQLELSLGLVELPTDDLSFVLKHNGGAPRPNHFTYKGKGGKATSVWVANFLPLVVDPIENLHSNVIGMLLRLRRDIPAECLPIGFAVRDDPILLYIDGNRSGQIWLKDFDQVEMRADRKPTPPTKAIYFLAPSFNDFLGKLREDDSD
jgi:hypothetical protein